MRSDRDENVADVLRRRLTETARRLLGMADETPLPNPTAVLVGAAIDQSFGDLNCWTGWRERRLRESSPGTTCGDGPTKSRPPSCTPSGLRTTHENP